MKIKSTNFVFQEDDATDQAARVISPHQDHHTISAKFESLDYEVCENELYRNEERKESHQVSILCSDPLKINERTKTFTINYRLRVKYAQNMIT